MARKKVEDIDGSKSEFITLAQFQREVIPWSSDTIKIYIANEDMPAIKTRSGYVFNREKVREWFKRREIQAS